MVRRYIRDGRAPIPEREITSKIMSRIKGKDTHPEILLRKALWGRGLKGYRLHWKKVIGNPDICFIRRKIAVFVHGCFWHRCPHCKMHIPKTHSGYWREKFNKNVMRDKRYQEELRKQGWRHVVVWECEIKTNLNKGVNRISKLLKSKVIS